MGICMLENIKSARGIDNFTKNLVLVVLFFIATPFVIIACSISLVSLPKASSNLSDNYNQSTTTTNTLASVKVYAPLTTNYFQTQSFVVGSDGRGELIRQYLRSHYSPLEPYADLIVRTADKYMIDYRLITAIAQQESNLCRVIPDETYNCWGWGIHSKGTLGFSSYEDAIETVTKGIREKYVDQGYNTVDDIMAKYTPLSSGSWAEGVKYFMDEIEISN